MLCAYVFKIVISSSWIDPLIIMWCPSLSLQRIQTDGQEAHEKMLNITNCREMQIKSTMRYHLTPVRMTIIKKSTIQKCWRVCVEKGTLLYRWWECKLVQPLWRTVWSFLKKLKIELPYDPAIPLLGIYPEKT